MSKKFGIAKCTTMCRGGSICMVHGISGRLRQPVTRNTEEKYLQLPKSLVFSLSSSCRTARRTGEGNLVEMFEPEIVQIEA